jgi:hypothetical protein
LLTPVREERPAVAEPAAEPVAATKPARGAKPCSQSKPHIGGYYDPDDGTIVSSQKLGIDHRRLQQGYAG